MFALTRHASVTRALRDWETFSSASGVMMNEDMNQVLRGNTLCSDGVDHDALRRVVIKPLRPRELATITEDITREAEQVVDRVVATIFAITSAVALFAEYPDQWDLVRADPSLIPGAMNEVLRMETPIQDFSRLAIADYDMDGVAGDRVLRRGRAGRARVPGPRPVRRAPQPHQPPGFRYRPARLSRGVLGPAGDGRCSPRSPAGSAASSSARARALHNILRGYDRLDITVR